MKLGFARRDITPDFSVPLAGYAPSGIRIPADTRIPIDTHMSDIRMSAGIHDKLYVRALVFAGGNCSNSRGSESAGSVSVTAVLQFDLLNLDHLCMEKIRDGAAALGLERDKVLVFCIHTHSGYGGIFDMNEGIKEDYETLFGPPDPRLVELTVRESLLALEEALHNEEETTVRINRGTIEGLGTNRHGPEHPCDKSIFMMEFYRLDRKKILLYNLSCHPTVMNGSNLLVSADFPGAVASRIEDVPGGCDLVVFINGAAGDMSTRFTRQESGPARTDPVENSFAECKRFAALIEKTLLTLRQGVFLPLEKVRLIYYSTALKRAELPDCTKSEELLEQTLRNYETLKEEGTEPALLRKAESLVEGARINLAKARAAVRRAKSGAAFGAAKSGLSETAPITVETGILRINGETIVCPPLELFSSLSLELQRRKEVQIFGYANALLGYLADTGAYDAMEYEALSSDFARGEGEYYIEQLYSVLS